MSDWIDGRIPPEEQKPTVGQLVERLSEQATRLVRSEIALAKAELTTKAKHAGIGIGLLVVGGVLVLYGLGFLLHSAMEGLATAMPLWLAALIVGGALVLVAGTLAFVGVKQLQRGVPRRRPARSRASRKTSRPSRKDCARERKRRDPGPQLSPSQLEDEIARPARSSRGRSTSSPRASTRASRPRPPRSRRSRRRATPGRSSPATACLRRTRTGPATSSSCWVLPWSASRWWPRRSSVAARSEPARRNAVDPAPMLHRTRGRRRSGVREVSVTRTSGMFDDARDRGAASARREGARRTGIRATSCRRARAVGAARAGSGLVVALRGLARGTEQGSDLRLAVARWPPRVRIDDSLPAFAQRVTVLGSTRKRLATSAGVSRTSDSPCMDITTPPPGTRWSGRYPGSRRQHDASTFHCRSMRISGDLTDG